MTSQADPRVSARAALLLLTALLEKLRDDGKLSNEEIYELLSRAVALFPSTDVAGLPEVFGWIYDALGLDRRG